MDNLKLKNSKKISYSFSLQIDPAGGGALPRADGLPRWVLSKAWWKAHQGLAIQASSNFSGIQVKTSFWTCRFSLLLPLLTSLLSVLYHDRTRDFLICSSREEVLRFNLEDFWKIKVVVSKKKFISFQIIFNLLWCRFFSGLPRIQWKAYDLSMVSSSWNSNPNHK